MVIILPRTTTPHSQAVERHFSFFQAATSILNSNRTISILPTSTKPPLKELPENENYQNGLITLKNKLDSLHDRGLLTPGQVQQVKDGIKTPILLRSILASIEHLPVMQETLGLMVEHGICSPVAANREVVEWVQKISKGFELPNYLFAVAGLHSNPELMEFLGFSRYDLSSLTSTEIFTKSISKYHAKRRQGESFNGLSYKNFKEFLISLGIEKLKGNHLNQPTHSEQQPTGAEDNTTNTDKVVATSSSHSRLKASSNATRLHETLALIETILASDPSVHSETLLGKLLEGLGITHGYLGPFIRLNDHEGKNELTSHPFIDFLNTPDLEVVFNWHNHQGKLLILRDVKTGNAWVIVRSIPPKNTNAFNYGCVKVSGPDTPQSFADLTPANSISFTKDTGRSRDDYPKIPYEIRPNGYYVDKLLEGYVNSTSPSRLDEALPLIQRIFDSQPNIDTESLIKDLLGRLGLSKQNFNVFDRLSGPPHAQIITSHPFINFLNAPSLNILYEVSNERTTVLVMSHPITKDTWLIIEEKPPTSGHVSNQFTYNCFKVSGNNTPYSAEELTAFNCVRVSKDQDPSDEFRSIPSEFRPGGYYIQSLLFRHTAKAHLEEYFKMPANKTPRDGFNYIVQTLLKIHKDPQYDSSNAQTGYTPLLGFLDSKPEVVFVAPNPEHHESRLMLLRNNHLHASWLLLIEGTESKQYSAVKLQGTNSVIPNGATSHLNTYYSKAGEHHHRDTSTTLRLLDECLSQLG